MLAGEVLVRGAYRTVRFARQPGGKLAARDDWDALPDNSRARLLAYFEYYANNPRVQNPSQFKKLGGTDLWQWRHRDYRVLCCDKGREHIICVVLTKLNQKLAKTVYARATRICNEDIGGESS